MSGTEEMNASREYASAMFALASEESAEKHRPEIVDRYLERSAEIREILKSYPEWVDLLASPCISAEERRQAADRVLLFGQNDENSEMYENFASLAKLLSDRGEARILDDVLRDFERICRMTSGIVTAKVTSAVELTDDEKARLKKSVEKKLGRRVELECAVDPSILGGVIIRADEMVLDGSLKKKLSGIRSAMEG